MSRSRYDELHDKYDAILTTKSGTRYERLAAMVFKALEESTAVIHDVSLLGESDVSHQIDVHVTIEGQSRRVLIECKDFDISGDKVGLPIVRNFWAVLDNTRANEGFIITCNGFTGDAAKYAKAKGIKLVVLRIHEEKDWEGYIKTVVVRLLALAPANPTMTVHVSDEAAIITLTQQNLSCTILERDRPVNFGFCRSFGPSFIRIGPPICRWCCQRVQPTREALG